LGSPKLHQNLEFYTKIENDMKASISYYPNTAKKVKKQEPFPSIPALVYKEQKRRNA
jgi:hypothetical protein